MKIGDKGEVPTFEEFQNVEGASISWGILLFKRVFRLMRSKSRNEHRTSV